MINTKIKNIHIYKIKYDFRTTINTEFSKYVLGNRVFMFIRLILKLPLLVSDIYGEYYKLN